MDLVYLLICAIFFVISSKWIISIFSARKWIVQETKNTEKVAFNHKPIFVLIPVLAEVDRIQKTVSYFLDTFSGRINIKIVLITTEAEYKYKFAGPNTIDICKRLARQNNNRILHVHYPKNNGRMSHQLNFAITKLGNILEPDSLLTVYNADSKPHPLTFDWVLQKRVHDPTQQIFQQYGDYTKNINGKTNGILLSAALWQNRWALGFELSKVLRSIPNVNNNYLLRPLNYVIGHGLFMTRNFYDQSIGFSEIFHNEDAILGLEISFLRQKIMPLPFFDVSDTPDTIRSLYTQKIHWFFGPYQAFKYFSFLLKKYQNCSLMDKITLALQSFKLFAHAIYWVAGPFFILFLLVYPLTTRNLLYILAGYSCFIAFLSYQTIYQ
ncbi:MAG: glycosyltransferase family 2 protein [Candidatus Woesebacteria bacterium]|jgi:hypothetical protein